MDLLDFYFYVKNGISSSIFQLDPWGWLMLLSVLSPEDLQSLTHYCLLNQKAGRDRRGETLQDTATCPSCN